MADAKYEYFEDAALDLRSECITAFDVALRADFVAAIDGLIAVCAGSTTTIYRWTSDLRFRKARTIHGSLLQFLINTRSVSDRTAQALLQILLFAVRNGVERCERFLEETMAHLSIGNVAEMAFVNGDLHCACKDLVTRVYDKRLRLVHTHLRTAPSAAPGVACDGVEVALSGTAVVIDRKKSFLERIEIGKVRQFVPVSNHVFLVTDENIKILKFVARK